MAACGSFWLAIDCPIPRSSSALISGSTSGLSVTSPSSRRMPDHSVLSRSHTTHWTLPLRGCWRCPTDTLAAVGPLPAVVLFVVVIVHSPRLSTQFRVVLPLERRVRDQDLLDLGAPLDNFHDLRVPEKAGRRMLVETAVRTVDLHRVARRGHRGPGGEVLRDARRRYRVRITLVFKPARLGAQQSRGPRAGRHV